MTGVFVGVVERCIISGGDLCNINEFEIQSYSNDIIVFIVIPI